MTSLLENSLTEGTLPMMDWYSTPWDTDCLNTVDLKNLAQSVDFDSLISNLDLTQFSDIFAGSSAYGVDINVPDFPQQLATPPEIDNLIGIPSPLNTDLRDELVADISTSSDISSPSIVDPSYSPISSRRRHTRQSHNLNSPSRQKTLHNAVERRYRDNLNNKFLALAQRMPTVYGEDTEVVMGRKPPKCKAGELYQSKTDILDHGLLYLDRLHKDQKVLKAQVASLKKNLQATRLAKRQNNKSGAKS